MDVNNKEYEPVIEAKHISKTFRLYKRKRDVVKQVLKGNKKRFYSEYCALDNFNLVLNKGDSVGIIGKNGSGKSTALQIICSILKPTSGSLKVRGKIAALLELGSGFNPEFTGIENIYLNSLLHGLSKSETDNKLDKILSFADIGEFAEQPVKTYSSGMLVRLAFSVITNVNADILIIDEALAVGDTFFTQKCMRFINRFKEEGSLLFVSHDANTVQGICNKSILLNKGKTMYSGSPMTAISLYTKDIHEDNNKEWLSSESVREDRIHTMNVTEKKRWEDYRAKAINNSNIANIINICRLGKNIDKLESYGSGEAEIKEVEITNLETLRKTSSIMGGEIVRLEITLEVKHLIHNLIAGFILKNNRGLVLLGDNSENSLTIKKKNLKLEKGQLMKAEFIFTIPMLPQGEYSICAGIADGTVENHKILHWVNEAIILRSECTSICAGLAGVAMHSIEVKEV